MTVEVAKKRPRRGLQFRKWQGKPPKGWPEGWKVNCFLRIMDGVPETPGWFAVAWPMSGEQRPVESPERFATAQAAIRSCIALIQERKATSAV